MPIDDAAAPATPSRRLLRWLLGLLLLDVAVATVAPVFDTSQIERGALGEIVRFLDYDSNREDSWFPMRSALRLARHHEGVHRLYEEIFFVQRIKFQYPPTSLLFLVDTEQLVGSNRERVLDFLTATTWIAVWATLLVVGAAQRVTEKLVRTVVQSSWRRAALAFALSAAFALLSYPLLRGFSLGQIQTWINLWLSLAFLATLAGFDVVGGALVGLSILVKPQYGLLLVWALLRRRFSFAASLAVVAGAGLARSIYVFGFPVHVAYLEILQWISRRGEVYFANQSANGLLNRLAGLFHPGDPAFNNTHWANQFAPEVPWVRTGTALTTLAILVWALWRKPQPTRIGKSADMGAALLAATAASPIAWEHHYGIVPVLVVFALTVIAYQGEERERSRLFYATAAGFLLVENFFGVTLRLADTPFNVLESFAFFGALALLAVLIHLARRPISPASPSPDAGTERRS